MATLDEIFNKPPQRKESLESIFGVPKKPIGSETIADVRGIGEGIIEAGQNRFKNVKESIGALGDRAKDVVQSTKEEGIKGGIQAAVAGEGQGINQTLGQLQGQGAGFVSDVIGEGVMGIGKAVVPEKFEQGVKDNISPALAAIPLTKNITDIANSEPVKKALQRFEELKVSNPEAARDLDAAFGLGSLALDIVGGGTAKVGTRLAKEGVETTGRQIVKTAGEITEQLGKGLDDIVAKVPGNIPNPAEQVTKFLSNSPDEKVVTILKETPRSKFDEYIKVAEDAASDPRKITPFEKVGQKADEALKQLDKRLSSIGEQKSAILKKANIGRTDMSQSVKETVRDIRKTFMKAEGSDKALVDDAIRTLEESTRLEDVDAAIDKLQDIIYKGRKNLTLPLGKTTAKRLGRIVEGLNSKVKEIAGDSYKTLNDKYAKIIQQRDYLNRVLGEKVGGVNIKGGSIVKRFFSPSDAGTKELFDFLKKELNIDLSQDATLAKFSMEAFQDPRARSLLEGIPTSPTGLVEKVVDFAAERSGAAKKIRQTIKQGEIQRARELTRNNISQEFEPLVQEARKYKSAEEFVNKSPNIYLHGTSVEGDLKLGDGVTYLTKDTKAADGFANDVMYGSQQGGIGRTEVIQQVGSGKSKTISIPDNIGTRISGYVKNQAEIAKREGYRFLEFRHPPMETGSKSFQVKASLFPKDDLRLISDGKMPSLEDALIADKGGKPLPNKLIDIWNKAKKR